MASPSTETPARRRPLLKRRAEAVLAVLAVCGDLGWSRERLLALLWPESDEAGARQGLRDALCQKESGLPQLRQAIALFRSSRRPRWSRSRAHLE